MACSSSAIWRVATLDSCTKVSSYLSKPASMFLFFSTTNSNKTLRLIACSLDPISTSSLTSQNATHKNRTDKKSVEIQRTNDGTFSVLHSDEHKPHEKKIKNSKKDEAKNGANKGLKSGSKKRRPFWQKTFFASKKMRSILLFNAITIVYVEEDKTIWVFIGGWFDGSESSNQLIWTSTEMWDWLVAFPWIPALHTGAFSTGLCLWIEIAAMHNVSATETAIIYGMEPLWGAAFAWFLLGERWGALGWIGAALVLDGSLVVQIYGSSSSEEFIGSKEKGDLLRVPVDHKLQNGLSTSPLLVRSKKDSTDFLK